MLPPFWGTIMDLAFVLNPKQLRGRKIWKILLPVLRPLSVVCLAVCRLPGNGIQLAPSVSPHGIDFSFFLLGKLFVGNVLFHFCTSKFDSVDIISKISISDINDLQIHRAQKRTNPRLNYLQLQPRVSSLEFPDFSW